MPDRAVAFLVVLVAAAGIMMYIVTSAGGPEPRITAAHDLQPSGNLLGYDTYDFTDEFETAPNVEEPAIQIVSPELEVRGAWGKPDLTVFAESDFGYDTEAFVQRLLDRSSGDKMAWNELLYEKRAQSEGMPVLAAGKDTGADIFITLQKEALQSSLGSTRIYLDDNKTIIKAVITINVREGTGDEALLVIASHELGHALGLGHSTNESSIMSRTISLEGGEDGIGTCESKALEQLYLERHFDTVAC